jgi:ADP-heptose:LPS heptosyltransferase
MLSEHELIQVGAEGDEQIVPYFRKGLSFSKVGELIEDSDTAICVDSYLQHHCWFLNKKAIVLWGMSDPLIFGHTLHLNLLKDRSFLRPNQFDLYYSSDYLPESFVSPDEVLKALNMVNE